MLELIPSAAMRNTFDVLTIDERTDQELDTLPFGVIGLDREGTILRYNLYEAQFARLDRNQVLGRGFFTEVARCTRGEVFEGQFRKGVASDATGSLARFPFIFDFKFGAQEVEVEIVRPPGAPRFYLLINRMRVGPARPVAADQLAIQQRELAPDELTRGVRRDPVERRIVEVPWAFFAALRATCDQLAPGTWQMFCAEWGVQYGRRLAIDLENEAIERSGQSVGELPMNDFAAMLSRRLAQQGMGRATFDFVAIRDGLLVIQMSRSMLAEAAPRGRASAPDPIADLACPLLAGIFGAVIGHVAGRRLVGREVACGSAGGGSCSFIITGHGRRKTVDDALTSGVRGVDAVREILARAPAGAQDE